MKVWFVKSSSCLCEVSVANTAVCCGICSFTSEHQVNPQGDDRGPFNGQTSASRQERPTSARNPLINNVIRWFGAGCSHHHEPVLLGGVAASALNTDTNGSRRGNGEMNG